MSARLTLGAALFGLNASSEDLTATQKKSLSDVKLVMLVIIILAPM